MSSISEEKEKSIAPEAILTKGDLAFWGVHDVAYVKPSTNDETGKLSWAIYAAEGTKIAEVSDRKTAFVVVKQNDMEPFSVH